MTRDTTRRPRSAARRFARAGARSLLLTLACQTASVADRPAPSEPPPAGEKGIRRIDLLHLSHTDIGFTDHPAVCRDLYVRYLDIALDAIEATRGAPEPARFC
jgi:hypothetical protein